MNTIIKNVLITILISAGVLCIEYLSIFYFYCPRFENSGWGCLGGGMIFFWSLPVVPIVSAFFVLSKNKKRFLKWLIVILVAIPLIIFSADLIRREKDRMEFESMPVKPSLGPLVQ